MIVSESLGFKKIAGDADTEVVIDRVPFGVHDLTLRLLNKEENDTVVDDAGKIVDDLYVVINSLKIDGHDIMHKINSISTYHDNHGNKINTYGWMSFAQNYEIWLQCPGWYFARNLSILNENDTKIYLKDLTQAHQDGNYMVDDMAL